VVKKLQQLKSAESLLVPTEHKLHGTCLLVTKTDNETFQLTLYNAGQGCISWHYRWENTNFYQTFDIIDNVPKESVYEINTWLELAMISSEAVSMDPIYRLIHEQLGKGGTVSPPSPNLEDYEAKQHSGTCSMQCLLALLRHQCMQLAIGSPAEKEATYKLIKTMMLLQYHQDNFQHADKAIQTHLKTVIKKLKAEAKAVEIAADSAKFEEAMRQIKESLLSLNKHQAVEQLEARDSSTKMARYATLRTASKILSEALLELPQPLQDKNLSKNEFFRLAFAVN